MARPKDGKTLKEQKAVLEKYNRERKDHALAIQQEVLKDAAAKKTNKKQS